MPVDVAQEPFDTITTIPIKRTAADAQTNPYRRDTQFSERFEFSTWRGEWDKFASSTKYNIPKIYNDILKSPKKKEWISSKKDELAIFKQFKIKANQMNAPIYQGSIGI